MSNSTIVCARCQWPVVLTNVTEGYFAWCPKHDEDLYEIETMSVVGATIDSMIRECPRHEGGFDCTPFCDVCEGDQEYEYTETRPCYYCQTPVDHDIWFEESGMCVDCSNKYYSEDN